MLDAGICSADSEVGKIYLLHTSKNNSSPKYQMAHILIKKGIGAEALIQSVPFLQDSKQTYKSTARSAHTIARPPVPSVAVNTKRSKAGCTDQREVHSILWHTRETHPVESPERVDVICLDTCPDWTVCILACVLFHQVIPSRRGVGDGLHGSDLNIHLLTHQVPSTSPQWVRQHPPGTYR